MNEEFALVKINAQEFSKHHDECLAVADELFVLIEELTDFNYPFALSLSTKLNNLANRLDKSISKLPVKFD